MTTTPSSIAPNGLWLLWFLGQRRRRSERIFGVVGVGWFALLDGGAQEAGIGAACTVRLRERTGDFVSVHFMSERMDWNTPREVFNGLHAEFGFTIDVCASSQNALLSRHWTEADDALLRSWQGERVWMNPPYGRAISRWMEKAWTESAHALIVALVPSRTDTAWWHDYVMPADEIRFLRGRLEFGGVAKGNPQSHNAPFPSCLVVYRGAVVSGTPVARVAPVPEEEK